jgi:hypothetical protein
MDPVRTSTAVTLSDTIWDDLTTELQAAVLEEIAKAIPLRVLTNLAVSVALADNDQDLRTHIQAMMHPQ